MKLVSSKLCLVVASVALLLAGCTKKPARPDPASTMIGQPIGPANPNLYPSGIPTSPAGTSLIDRGNDDFGPDGNRTALAANTVYFDFDQTAIKASERDKLKNAKDYLDKNPTARLMLEGHCDWRGTADYNLGLGDRRANAVKKYLLTLGVAADRLEPVSKGSLDAKPNADAATMEKDRRVDLVIPRGK